MGAWSPPQSFDGYLLFRLLGRGGMGEVHLASDSLLDRQVAIKFISAPEVDRQARQRFLVEARAVAKLQHPNVAAVHRIGEVDGYPYLVTEFVDGENLQRLLAKLPADKILSVATDVAGALACAHGRGILHRDIKPANVILSKQGEAKLLDFGIAKFVEGAGAGFVPELPDLKTGGEESVDLDATPAGLKSATLDDDATPAGIRPAALDELLPETPVTADSSLQDGMQLTMPGTLMGSPRYMAPELWAGLEASYASDVYAFGALVFALCAGRPPYVEKDIGRLREKVCKEDPPSLAKLVDAVDPGLVAVVERCLRRDPADRYADGNALRSALAGLGKSARGTITPEGNPYRGLYSFEAEHRNLFFGRDSETRMILERLKAESAVLVVGDSGVGKSSLCRAAVLPRVADWLGENRRWQTVSMVPGQRPLEALARALAISLEMEQAPFEKLLQEDPLGASRQVSRQLGQERGLVLFVDQLEELLTQSLPEQRTATVQVLAWLVQPIPGLRVLATVRGDHLSRLASLPAFADGLARALYFLRPLSTERLREAITGPAKAKGVVFESEELLDELVQATEEAEGGLPLLQFALAELWEARGEKQVIGREALQRIGGVSGALSRHADQVLDQMLPRVRPVARSIMLALLLPDGTRAQRTSADLGLENKDRRLATDALVRGRLVVARQTGESHAFAIAHESLVHGWGRLARWLAENAEARQLRERLRQAAAEWRRLSDSAALLWKGPQLAEAGELGNTALSKTALSKTERAFLVASRRRHRRARVWRWGLGLGLPLLVLSAFLGMHLLRQAEFGAKVDERLRQGAGTLAKVEALRPGLEKARLAAYALFDAGKLDEAEGDWQVIRRQEETLAKQVAGAAGLLESTAWLDPSREDVRSTWVRALVLQARLAQAAGHQERRDGFLSRLEALGALPAGMAPGGRLRPAIKAPVQQADTTILDGFVYIPPGAFYFGSGAEDDQRREFFHAVPIHEIKTEAYWIATHETSFADWIDFLESLKPEQQKLRSPRVGKEGFAGAVGLRRLKSGSWVLRFKPTSKVFEVKRGEVITYPGRPHGARQDWLRMPVVGVTLDDAKAYCRWLDASGKVPGARVCSEEEWERAARGSDDREYPHGWHLAPDEANFDETYGKQTEAMGPDAVGSHPASASPFGLQDMAGNVWELCSSALKEGQVVARGGSFYFGMNSSRLTDREVVEPAFRDVSVGFRVCADPSIKP